MAKTVKDKSHVDGLTATPLTSDPCVCAAVIGGIFVGTTNRIFIRVNSSTPCNVNDWVEMTSGGGGSGSFRFTADDGSIKIVNTNDNIVLNGLNGLTTTITSSTINVNGHLYSSTAAPTGTPVDPTQVSFHLNTTTNGLYVWKPTTSTWIVISKPETVTTLVNNGNGTYTYTNEIGAAVTFAFSQTVTTFVNNNNGTFTYTNELGNTTVVDIAALIAEYVDVTTNVALVGTVLQFRNSSGLLLLAVDLAALKTAVSPNAGNMIQSLSNGIFAQQTVTTLVDNGNGSITYTNEAGASTTVSAGAQTVTTLVNNNNGTYTYTNEVGAQTIINVAASSLLVNPASLIGVGRAITGLTISSGQILLNSVFDHVAETYKQNNTAIVATPIPLSVTGYAPIVLPVTNPSANRSAKAQISFLGYPISVVTGTTNNVYMNVTQSVKINNAVPTDYTAHISRFKIVAGDEFSFNTQPYTTTVTLNPAQTVQVEISLTITVTTT